MVAELFNTIVGQSRGRDLWGQSRAESGRVEVGGEDEEVMLLYVQMNLEVLFTRTTRRMIRHVYVSQCET